MNQQFLNQLLTAHGFSATEFSPITTGKFNQTYRCRLNLNKNQPWETSQFIILRIAPPDNSGFLFYEKKMMLQEPELHRIIQEKTAIPIPKIFVLDQSREIGDFNFLIEEHLQGIPFSEVQVSHLVQNQIFKKTGQYLRELHQNCQQNHYGYLGKHCCMKPQKNWNSAFLIMWNKLVDDILTCKVYDRREGLKALQALDKNIQYFNRKTPASLLHMDIWAQNILIDDDGNITGILDWDRALWGDPEIEFAVLDYCGFNNQPFWNGYGKKPEIDENKQIRMQFYHLYEVQKYLVIWTLRRSDPMRVQQYKDYSLKSIDRLLS